LAGATAMGVCGTLAWQRAYPSLRPRAALAVSTVRRTPAALARSLPAPSAGAPRGRINLAEVTAEVAAAGARGFWRLDKVWENIINALTPDDIRALLAEIERAAHPAALAQLRDILFNRWGECDPAGALAAIDAIADREKRAEATRQML